MAKNQKLVTFPQRSKRYNTSRNEIPDCGPRQHRLGICTHQTQRRFDVLDHLVGEAGISFEDGRYGLTAQHKHKGRQLTLLKPSTYVNLSGRAVNYWLQKEKIPIENLLVVVDDLALPFGVLRLRAKGSDAGHNGLKNINEVLGHNQYARLRFGIGDNFRKGQQVDYVLGQWERDEKEALPERFELATEIIHSFASMGCTRTMNTFNKR